MFTQIFRSKFGFIKINYRVNLEKQHAAIAAEFPRGYKLEIPCSFGKDIKGHYCPVKVD